MGADLKGIAFIALRMNDYEVTKAFYTRLGLQEGYVSEDKSDVSFSFSTEGYSEDSSKATYTDLIFSKSMPDVPPNGETGIRIKIKESANLWDWVKRMQAEGVEFMTSDVVETDWVYEIKLKDPAGNILTFFK